MSKLSQENIDRIKADAERYADLFKHGAGYREPAYADGALHEAGRAQVIVDLLEMMVAEFTGAAEMSDKEYDKALIKKSKKELAKYKEAGNG